jgi:hypothetical protein
MEIVKLENNIENSWENIKPSNTGCFFIEYLGEMRPIYYIYIETWNKLLNYYGKQMHNAFKALSNEDGEDSYILNINQMGMHVLPVPKSTLQQMIYEGDLVENINILDFVKKHNEKHKNITNDFMEESLKFINVELNKMNSDIKNYEILQSVNRDDIDFDEISSVSSTSSAETCNVETCSVETCNAETCNVETCNAETCNAETCNVETCNAETCDAETCNVKTCSMETYNVETYNQ